jgi:hypothetical protein
LVTPGRIWYSDNGHTWSKVTVDGDQYGIIYNIGLYIAVGGDSYMGGGKIWCSRDGIIWKNVEPEYSLDYIYEVAFGCNLFIAVGMDGNIIYSSDGYTWEVEFNASSDLYSICYRP